MAFPFQWLERKKNKTDRKGLAFPRLIPPVSLGDVKSPFSIDVNRGPDRQTTGANRYSKSKVNTFNTIYYYRMKMSVVILTS